jgi:hypothetical protein
MQPKCPLLPSKDVVVNQPRCHRLPSQHVVVKQRRWQCPLLPSQHVVVKQQPRYPLPKVTNLVVGSQDIPVVTKQARCPLRPRLLHTSTRGSQQPIKMSAAAKITPGTEATKMSNSSNVTRGREAVKMSNQCNTLSHSEAAKIATSQVKTW